MKRIVFGTYIFLAVLLGGATFIEKGEGTEYVAAHIYGSWWFSLLWGVLVAGAFIWFWKQKLIRKPIVWLLHISFIVILVGALLTSLIAERGILHLRQGIASETFLLEDGRDVPLPFSVKLDTFYIEYYPGTQAPSDYVSRLTVSEKGKKEQVTVSMNRIYRCKGYRFYQSSFDEDVKGSWLMVNRDPWGIGCTYVGYILMAMSMLAVLFSSRTRFRKLLRHPLLRVFILVLACLSYSVSSFAASAPNLPTLSRQQADVFGQLRVVYNDRQVPVHTLARDFTLKLTGKSSWKGYTAGQVFAGWLFYPEEWQHESMLSVDNKEVRKVLGCGEYIAVDRLFMDDGTYRLAFLLAEIRKKEKLNMADKAVIALDDKMQLIIMLQQGNLLKMFPNYNAGDIRWYYPMEQLPSDYTEIEQKVVREVFSVLKDRLIASDTARVTAIINSLHRFQKTHGQTALIPDSKIKAEILYNRLNLVDWLFKINLGLGILALICFISPYAKIPHIFFVLLAILSVLYTIDLSLRIYISSQLPFGNGYETMLFMAWFIMLLPLFFFRRFGLFIAFGFLFSGFALLVAHLVQMNPQITPLVPVLSSPWLSIHVSLIMMSYALLGFITLNSITALLTLVCTSKSNSCYVIRQVDRLAVLSRIFLYPGTFLLGMGIFVGAVWANVSWGRYWGWDPKEVWALITFMIYALAFHTQSLKFFISSYRFHAFMLLASFLILMTYFGVNYFLGGMHTYVGTAETTVVWAPILIVLVFVCLLIRRSGIRYRLFRKQGVGK